MQRSSPCCTSRSHMLSRVWCATLTFQTKHFTIFNWSMSPSLGIDSADDTVTQIKLQYMLTERVSDFATVYIESSEIHAGHRQPWYAITFIEIPQYVSQYLLIASCILFVTLLVSCSCLICLQLSSTPIIEHAIVVPHQQQPLPAIVVPQALHPVKPTPPTSIPSLQKSTTFKKAVMQIPSEWR